MADVKTTTTTKSAKSEVSERPAQAGFSGKRMKVKFSRSPEAGGTENGVFVGINGTVYGYKFDEEVSVPVEVLEVINRAIITKYTQDKQGNMIPSNVQRYPYQVIA
jgi:hypothetical protein